MTIAGDKITLRPFGEGDFEPLAALVGRTWLSEFAPRAQRAGGGVELAHYLAETTWSLVAEREGEILGAVLVSERGREAGETSRAADGHGRKVGGASRAAGGREAWLALERRLAEDAERDPELAGAVRAEMDGVAEEALLEDEYLVASGGAPAAGAEGEGGPGADAATRPCADAAIKLLIVSPDAKGLGIGGKLFSAAVERMRETGARGFHLLTDDACDVGFYEHKGLACALRRRSQVAWPGSGPTDDPGPDPSSEDDEFHIYVYEREF